MSWLSYVLHCRNFAWISAKSLCALQLDQKFDGRFQELTFLPKESAIGFLGPNKYSSKPFIMLCLVCSIDNNVVQLTLDTPRTLYNHLHAFLKVLQSWGNPKWKMCIAVSPQGVMTVAKGFELSFNSCSQKPQFASSLEITFMTASFRRICSLACMGWFSCKIAFPHIRTFPLDFGTTMVGEHHSVGTSTFLITPMTSIQASSSLTFGNGGIGTHLGWFGWKICVRVSI